MTTSEVIEPYYVAVHDSSDIFATSRDTHCIFVFDKYGRKKATIGAHGNGDGQFNFPVGIAIGGDVMYVSESGNNRIQKLTVTGEFLTKFGTEGSGNGQLSNPSGICLSSKGNVYVTEVNNGRVHVFNPDGTFSSIIKGQGKGVLQQPYAVAFDSSENLHVADYYSKCVKVFTADGNYVRQYGSVILQSPAGIAVDQDGYCIVGDYGGKCLSIFDPQGNVVHSLPNLPVWGVTLDKQGFVYLANCENGPCVFKF